MTLIIEIILITLLFLALLELSGWKHYIARGADYLQLQLAILVGALAIVHFMVDIQLVFLDTFLYLLSFSLLLRAVYRLLPYTPFFHKEVEDAAGDTSDISVLVANLKYDNDQYERAEMELSHQVHDVIVLVEVTPQWESALVRITEKYPYQKKIVREDPWGMVVLSKWEIVDQTELKIYNDTPTLILSLAHEKCDIDLCVLHPKPPFPMDAHTSKPKDVEFTKMRKLIDGRKKPTIVAGDLNDVAWSRPTRQFLKAANLKDPRKGRGIYGSFPTYAAVLSFPLDQIFVSEHFQLVSFKKLKHIGSDHFPIHAAFSIHKIGSEGRG